MPTLPHHKGACYCRQRRVIIASQCSAWSCSAGVRLWCLQPKGMGSTGALTARHPVCSHTHKKSCLAKNCLQLAPASPVDARVIGAGRPGLPVSRLDPPTQHRARRHTQAVHQKNGTPTSTSRIESTRPSQSLSRTYSWRCETISTRTEIIAQRG
jgi:hypothetical protein